jgi:hypothetical protein
MSIDAYSLCPGGTGKKIKFCCGDFLPELQKIDRMVEGEQYLGCLKHIDHLLEQEPGRDRECLLATKCVLLRMTDQHEAAMATAKLFLDKHPNNQVALAEMAMLNEENDARGALAYVLQAIRAANGALSGRTYQAMGLTAGALLREGFPLPARALLQIQCAVAEQAGQDDRPGQLLSGLCQATDVPLLLRGDVALIPCPTGVPWENRFEEAEEAIAVGDWQKGADRLDKLSAEVSDSSAVWRTLAMLRGWLADNEGCIAALHKYAALRAGELDGLEDAVEAEAQAMFLSPDPLGDHVDILKLTWAVRDVERTQEALLSSPRFRTVPFDPAQFADGQTPPPKAAYMVLDRPMPDSAEGLTVETMPRLVGQALLFGRQTDREALLEVLGVAADEVSIVKELVQAVAGDAVDTKPEEEVVGDWSASQKILRAAWQPPRDATGEQLRPLMEQHEREAVFSEWPNLKLGVLGGRTPREAAKDENLRARVLAAILVLDHWLERLPSVFDLNELRAELGLPTLGPVAAKLGAVEELPITRLERLSVEGLSDEDLLTAYYRAGAYSLRLAMRKFAQAVIDRPSLADSDERLHAFATLARTEENLAQAMDYVDQGRRAAEAKKESSASWDLMELSFRFASRDGREAMRLIEHLQRSHLEEPGVGEALTRMLMDVGLLRPDGSPAFGPGAAGAAPMAEAAAEEPGGLWTPDSAQPGAGGGKLWTPD